MLVKGQAPKVLIIAQAGADCRQSQGELTARLHGSEDGQPASIFSGCEVVSTIPPYPEGRGFSRRN
jgi:hypothetical protein